MRADAQSRIWLREGTAMELSGTRRKEFRMVHPFGTGYGPLLHVGVLRQSDGNATSQVGCFSKAKIATRPLFRKNSTVTAAVDR